MAEFPSLPLWTDAYLADTSHLSEAEHGRYLLLLIHLWRAPMQRFPNNDAWLARKFQRSVEVFVSEWKPLMQEFMQNDGNWWTSKRMQKEFAYIKTLSEKRRDAANARWAKEKGDANCNGPTPTPIKKIEEKEQVSQNGGYARGRGAPLTTPALADENLEKFMTRLAKELDGTSGGRGWTIVGSATDDTDPLHGRCLLLCKVAAKNIGKGWPFNWPKDHAIFDRIVTGGLSEQPSHDQQI